MQYKIFYINLVNFKFKKSNFFTYIIVCLLSLLVGNFQPTLAQPNSFSPVSPAGGDKGGASGNSDNKGGAGSYSPEQLAEINDAKNIWKTDLANENSDVDNKLMVNFDSLYGALNSLRKLKSEGNANYTYKIYPNFILAKIHGTDTNVYKHIVYTNKYYSKFKIPNDAMNNKIEGNLKLFDDMAYPFKFKTAEVFNNILPPLVLIDTYKMKPNDYEKILSEFFIENPELIFLCSKKFVSMLEHKEYDKLMKLHKISSNTLDFRAESRANKQLESK